MQYQHKMLQVYEDELADCPDELQALIVECEQDDWELVSVVSMPGAYTQAHGQVSMSAFLKRPYKEEK